MSRKRIKRRSPKTTEPNLIDRLNADEKGSLAEAEESGYLVVPQQFTEPILLVYQQRCRDRQRTGVLLLDQSGPAVRADDDRRYNAQIWPHNLGTYFNMLEFMEARGVRASGSNPVAGAIDIDVIGKTEAVRLAKLAMECRIVPAVTGARAVDVPDPLLLLRSVLLAGC